MTIANRKIQGGALVPVYIAGQGPDAIAAEFRDELYYSRMGHGICGWVNEKTPGDPQVVLTDAGLIYNLAAGTAVFISQYCYAVESVSDSCQFEFGWTDQANGAGTFTPTGPHKHVYTGAANTGRTAYDQDIFPAARLRYSDGVRCITFRVDASDASCVITVGWHGWWEAEI